MVAPWRIGIDVGGTFTDLVVRDQTGCHLVVKVPSTRDDPSTAVQDALEVAASRAGMPVQHLLEGCALLLHGSTVATNTLLEARGARVGLLANAGLRDALETRRGIRQDQWDHRTAYAPVLVPRYLRRPVRGRLDRTGREIEPLLIEDIDEAAFLFVAEGVESIAICLLHSCLSPVHEQAAAARLEELLPGVPVTQSSALSAQVGEYERTSTAVINAALEPVVAPYLRRLSERLSEMGLARPPLMMQSNGGAVSLERATRRPVELLLSGPAAAVGALEQLAIRADRGRSAAGDLLSLEIGGTSCDVLLMAEGRVESRHVLEVAGYRVATPTVDIHTVGAGGGAIARVDEAGLLVVGPEGAGAEPGPACYGCGGELPTATDAHLVLGRLRAFEGSTSWLELESDLARRAIEGRVAAPLDLELDRAAIGMLRLLEQHLVQAVESVSTARGRDPARFTLVAGGGAGPLHAASIARHLGIERVLVPRRSGVFCAEGMLSADVRLDFERPLLLGLEESREGARAAFSDLAEEAHRRLGGEGFAAEERRLEWELDLRYAAQTRSLPVPIPVPADVPGEVPVGTGLDLSVVRRDFEAKHERLYGHLQPEGTIEVTGARVRAYGALNQARKALEAPRVTSRPRVEPFEHRRVYVDERSGWCEVPVYRGADLENGAELLGPLLIEEDTTTILLGSGDVLEVDGPDYYQVRIETTTLDKSPESRLHRASDDPVTLALVQNRLDYISRRMGWVMTHTARSPIFSQAHDFSCFLTDAEGSLVSAADGIPIHSGGGGFAVRALLSSFPEDIHPGDVFVLNDPYAAGGNHLPDWVIARPVFAPLDEAKVDEEKQNRLVAFACNRAHQSDIGGGVAGTYNPEATEIFQEGLRLPPLRLVDRGVPRQDLWQMLLLNSRTPELLDGDLRAMIGSTRIGAGHIVELATELSTDRLLSCFDGVLEHGEKSARAAIAALPDGTYRATESTWGDCFDDREIPVAVAVEVAGNRLSIDFTGSGDQVRGFKNSPLANTTSAVLMALVSFFGKELPRNEGTLRAVDLEAPLGTIVNPRPPAPVTMCTVFIAHEIVHALWRALMHADPERACAGWGKSITGVTSGHVDGSEQPYVLYHWNALPGAGAVQGRDGFNQIGHLITLGGLTLPDVESVEHRYPVRILQQEFRLDGGGAGCFRGGTGVDYEIEVLTDALYSFRGEGLLGGAGYGVLGAGRGAEGAMTLELDEGLIEAPRYGLMRVGPCRVRAASPGGGGFGDPFERPVEAVLRDVRDRVVSRGAAREYYGVVLSDDERRVDRTRTDELRARPDR